MSGSQALPTTPFSPGERVDVRRFCGYPAYGSGAAGAQSYRYFEVYGLLEYRMTNLSSEEFQVVRQYLAALYALESGIVSAAGNLDTDKAAVWTHNRSEVSERIRLYDEWRRRLAVFIGVPLDPGNGLMSPVII